MRIPAGQHLPFDPFDGKPFRLRVGARPLDPANWIVLDERIEESIDEKYRLLNDSLTHSACIAEPTDDATAAACKELLGGIEDYLRAYEPDHLAQQNLRLAKSGELTAIDRAGRLVGEDWCVLMRSDHDQLLRLAAATLCFPSRWKLHEKVGLPLLDIHQPVPEYAEAIGMPTNASIDRITTDKPIWRVNWSVSDDPRLHQPTGHFDPSAGSRVVDIGNDVVLRIERQTLIRLPQSGAVVFGIRTIIRTLREVVSSDPSVADRMATSLKTMPDGMRAYKSLGLLGPRVVNWLETPSAR
jgi:dimethylamine monooxygenase subunit A